MKTLPSLLACAALIALAPTPVRAQPAPVAAASTADVIAAARKKVAEIYVIPETGAALDKALAAAEAKGAFKGLEGDALAAKVNEVMHTVTKDGHLGMRYDPQRAAVLAANPPSDDDEGELPASFQRDIVVANGGSPGSRCCPATSATSTIAASCGAHRPRRTRWRPRRSSSAAATR